MRSLALEQRSGSARKILIIALAAWPALALAAAPMKDGHPDLSGYWDLDARIPRDAALMKKIAPDTAVLDDTGPVEFPRGEYGGLKLKPAARDAADKWDPREDLTVAKACSPPSIVYAMQGPFPIQIDQGRDIVVIRLQYYDMVRLVFTDGRRHLPAAAPHTKVGDSIGHWEGDTLVVDTDHLEAATITNNGLSHSENVHVIERFRLSPDGRTLLSTQEFEDPQVLDNRGARFIAWKKQDGQYIEPYDCDPSFGLNYGK
jgi:hypothetical protein